MIAPLNGKRQKFHELSMTQNSIPEPSARRVEAAIQPHTLGTEDFIRPFQHLCFRFRFTNQA
jgi:hypothetical protein